MSILPNFKGFPRLCKEWGGGYNWKVKGQEGHRCYIVSLVSFSFSGWLPLYLLFVYLFFCRLNIIFLFSPIQRIGQRRVIFSDLEQVEAEIRDKYTGGERKQTKQCGENRKKKRRSGGHVG